MIEIDGSHGEGGGQILRLALLMSLATGKPFHMTRIRAARRQPGLKAQHVHVLKALGPLTGSNFGTPDVGQTDVEFQPGAIRGGSCSADIGTAGSITLWLQTILPLCLLAREQSFVRVAGGTDVEFSPTLDYLRHVSLPMAGLAASADLTVERRGFFPQGGGRVKLVVEPLAADPPPLAWTEESEVREIRIHSVAAEGLHDRDVAERQARAAVQELAPIRAKIARLPEYVDAPSLGSSVTVVAELGSGARLGASALGAPGKRAETVGREAATRLVEEITTGAPVDRHAGDQLVFWLWRRGGAIRISQMTDHTRTAIWVVTEFAGEWCHVDGNTLRRVE